MKPYYTVGSLQKGFDVLELLAARGPMRVSEVARGLGQHRSATNRFLCTLRDLGYLAQDPLGRYRLTLKLFNLGSKMVSDMQICALARPLMLKLVLQHQETVNLACLENDLVVVLEMSKSHLPIKYDLPLGVRAPAHACALGKAFLAHMDETDLSLFLDRAPLRKLTPKTLVSRRKLKEDLKQIRAAGYSVDNEEWSPGIRCIAVPIFGLDRRPHFAMSVSGPAQRITQEKVKDIAQDLMAISENLSVQLGMEIQPGTLGSPTSHQSG